MPWVKGQSGNPKGKRTATRDKINEAFLRNLAADWRKHGVEAIQACRLTHPEQYVAIVARLQPRDTHVSVTHELSQQFINAMRAANAVSHTTSGGEIINGSAEPVTDEAKLLIPHDTQCSK